MTTELKNAKDMTHEEFASAKRNLRGLGNWINRPQPAPAETPPGPTSLKAAAQKAGIVDLDALKLLDLTGVQVNEKGEAEGADALIDALKKSKPFLFGTQSTSSTHTPPRAAELRAKSAMEMTDDEWRAARKKLPR